MRRTSLVALRHSTALLPAGALIAACFGSTSTNPGSGSPDASFPVLDGALPPTFDSGKGGDSGHPADAGDAGKDGEAGVVAEAGETEAEAPEAGETEAGSLLDAGDEGDATDVADVSTVDAQPGATFSTATINFGLVNCGTAPAAKTYSFQNTGTAPLTYAGVIAAGGLFALQGGASGTLAPGETATLTIVASTVPASSTAGTPTTGVLTLTTNVAGSTSVLVPLELTPQGGSLTVAPAVAAFGKVQVTTPATAIPLVVSNAGNAPVVLSLGAPTNTDFSVAYTGDPAAVTIAAGGTLAGAKAEFTPTTTTAETATVALQTSSVLCASPATSISLSGQGSTEPVTVAPGSLDFGTVACGSTGTAKTFTITNGYTFDVTYTATLAGGAASPFTVDAASGTVAGSGQVTVTVTPKAIPVPGSVAADAFGDTLTVTTNAPGSTPSTVTLDESASGAVLALTMATTSFGDVTTGSSGSLPFTVTNSGNASASLSTTATGAGFAAALKAPGTAAPGGGTATGTATFAPTGTGTAAASGTLAVTSSGAVCSPASALTLSAQPEVAVASYSTAPVNFAATCTQGPSTAMFVTVTNTGNSPLDISAASTSIGLVEVVAIPGPIDAGLSGQIELVANPPAGTPAGTYQDTLSFTTNELNSPTHSLALPVALHGANLAFSGNAAGGTLNYNGVCYANDITYGISNTGDQDAVVTGPVSGNFLVVRFIGALLANNPLAYQRPFGNVGMQESIFAPGVDIPANATVTDAVADYDESCPSNNGQDPGCYSCGGPGGVGPGDEMYTFEETGNVCVALPALNYVYTYSSNSGGVNCFCS
jgi:hypothetical protein